MCYNFIYLEETRYVWCIVGKHIVHPCNQTTDKYLAIVIITNTVQLTNVPEGNNCGGRFSFSYYTTNTYRRVKISCRLYTLKTLVHNMKRYYSQSIIINFYKLTPFQSEWSFSHINFA